ncbi:hypothetical protein vseg_019795 [Gypsophila vaccaria]
MTKVKEDRVEAAMTIRAYAGKGKNGKDAVYVPPQCTHCGKYYHTEANCYEKHGYEEVRARERGRGRRKGTSGCGAGGRGRGRGKGNYQANAVGTDAASKENDSTTSNLPFTSEEIQRLKALLGGSPDGNEKFKGPDNEDDDWTR